MFKRIFSGRESGIALIELIIGLAIGGMIMVAATMTFIQILTVSTHTNNHLRAITQVQAAGNWISRDGEQSEANYLSNADNPGTAADDPLGGIEELTLGWDYRSLGGGDKHIVVYVLRKDPADLTRWKLWRDDYINDSPTPVKSIVAEDITNVEIVGGLGRYIQVRIQSTVGGFHAATAARTYSIYLRSTAGA